MAAWAGYEEEEIPDRSGPDLIGRCENTLVVRCEWQSGPRAERWKTVVDLWPRDCVEFEKKEVQRSGVQDLIVLFRRLGFTSAAVYLYWRISTGGGVL
jgi:hypothetical protein